MSTRTLESLADELRGDDETEFVVEAMADRCAYTIRAIKRFANGTSVESRRMISFDLVVQARDGIAGYI